MGIHLATLNCIHCVQSGWISPRCMESTAFNRDALGLAAWTPLHSIWMLLAMLHKIHCIQSSCRNPLHSIMLHKSTAFIGVPFIHAAWNQLHSITLHKIHCIQSGCIGPRFMESTACNHAAWSPLHSITLHGIHCIQSGCILPGCMEYTAFNHALSNSLHSIVIHCTTMHSIRIHCTTLHRIHCIQSGSI